MKKNGIALSVVTCHYGPHEQLYRLLHSLEKQSVAFDDFEWVVVDDGSPDGPPPFFSAYSGPLNIQSVPLKKNHGRSAARNAGWKKASGKIILFLDSDMELSRTAIESLKRDVERTRGVVVARLNPHPSLPKTAYLRYYHSRGGNKLPPGAELPGKYFTTGAVALEKKWLRRTGGFDESMKSWGGEDLELGLKLEKLDAPIFFSKRVLIYHFHDKDWPEIEKMYEIYGKETIPLLIDKYPGVERSLTLSLLYDKRTPFTRKWYCQKIVKIALKPIFYNFIRYLTTKYPAFAWPDIIFDYLVYYLYSTNYRKAGVHCG